MRLAEAALALEYITPKLVEFTVLGLFFGGRFNVSSLVDGVILAAFYGVEQDLGGFLDAFEERVVFGGAGGGFFVRVVAKDFFTVGALDLFGGCTVAVFGEAKDGVVVLALFAGEVVSGGNNWDRGVKKVDCIDFDVPSSPWRRAAASTGLLAR